MYILIVVLLFSKKEKAPNITKQTSILSNIIKYQLSLDNLKFYIGNSPVFFMYITSSFLNIKSLYSDMLFKIIGV